MERRVVKGWRTREAEADERIRELLRNAPRKVVYLEGRAPPTAVEKERGWGWQAWFRHETTVERQEIVRQIRELKNARRRRRYAERSPDQVEADRLRLAAAYQANRVERVKKNREWREANREKVRAWEKARHERNWAQITEAEREVRRERTRRARAARTPEQVARDNERSAALRREARARKRGE